MIGGEDKCPRCGTTRQELYERAQLGRHFCTPDLDAEAKRALAPDEYASYANYVAACAALAKPT